MCLEDDAVNVICTGIRRHFLPFAGSVLRDSCTARQEYTDQMHLHLQASFCVIAALDSGYITRHAPFIRHKSPANCDAHPAESIFQTRSSHPMQSMVEWGIRKVSGAD